MIGRKLKVLKNSTLLASVTTKSLSWSGESVDITSDDALGKFTVDSDTAQEQLEISVEGILADSTLMTAALGSGSKLLTDITLEFDAVLESGNSTPATLACDFWLGSFEISGEKDSAVTFSASLTSSGAWVYTPES